MTIVKILKIPKSKFHTNRINILYLTNGKRAVHLKAYTWLIRKELNMQESLKLSIIKLINNKWLENFFSMSAFKIFAF